MAEPGAEAGKEPVSDLIDDLIRDIFQEVPHPSKEAERDLGPLGAALMEAALSSLIRPVSQASTFERLLLSEAIASALADTLAPALARALAPEVMKALGHITGGEQGGERSSPAQRSGDSTQKSGAK